MNDFALLDEVVIGIPDPVDVLPAVPRIIEVISGFRQSYQTCRYFVAHRVENEELRGSIRVQTEENILRDIFLDELAGVTMFQKGLRVANSLWDRTNLIQTIAALESVNAYMLSRGHYLQNILREERQSYVRQVSWSNRADIHASVSLKMTLMLWFRCLMLRGPIPKCLVQPPPSELFNQMDCSGSTLIHDERDEDDLSDQLIHKQWFCHNVPLVMTTWHEAVCEWVSERLAEDDESFAATMASHRALLTTAQSVLKARLDLVTSIQIKVLGCAVTCLCWIVSKREQVEAMVHNTTNGII